MAVLVSKVDFLESTYVKKSLQGGLRFGVSAGDLVLRSYGVTLNECVYLGKCVIASYHEDELRCNVTA